MRLTPKREEIIRQRIKSGVGWSTEIELLAEIDAMRHNAKVVHNALRLEEVKRNTKDIQAVRALNLAKKALEFMIKATSTFSYPEGQKRCKEALDLIYKLEK